MSSASLAVAHRFHPDKIRVAGLSAAIALNLVVLVAALRPLEPAFVASIKLPRALTVVWNDPPPPPPPPPIELKALPTPTPPVVAPIKTPPVTPPMVVPRDTGSVQVPPVTAPTLAPPATDTLAPPAPVEASLAYLKAPIRFPPEAIRRHLQGTVLLRVLVDENGKPVDVEVEQSSGSPILDRSARAQVLAGWQFQPAMVDGRQVRAWARVPVTFNLREL